MNPWRLLVLLLLLANLGFFAWSRYFSVEGTSSEAHLLQQQLKPEAIRLIPQQQVKSLSARLACVEWGGFPPDTLAGAQEALGKLFPDVRPGLRETQEASTWWVFIPPLASRPAAQQKVAELRQLGVTELFLVSDEGRNRNAVSLGIFRTQEAARSRLDQLKGQGVRTAQVAPRESSARLTWLQLRNLPQDANARLAELKRAQPGSDLKTCAAAS